MFVNHPDVFSFIVCMFFASFVITCMNYISRGGMEAARTIIQMKIQNKQTGDYLFDEPSTDIENKKFMFELAKSA